MLLLGCLLLVVSVMYAERDYFYKSNQTTWDDARFDCQKCYKDLTTITPTNAEFLGLNLTSDYWIGLRQNINGSKFWSQWANGEPVLYQNWYPGHPVPKKKPEPQPICPCPTPPPIMNNTKTEVVQCPAFAKLCACLNSSEGNDYFLEPTTNNSTVSEMMWCPALAKLCACMNSSEDNKTSITESTTVFTPSDFVTNPTPTMLLSTSSPAINISVDLEPEYIEDSCVALLSFGMWQEKQCNLTLPYICYDDRFYGDVKIFNVTKSEGILSWSKVDIYIDQYRVEIDGQTKIVTNETSYQISNLDPGTFYRVQVIPVKCARDLNPQNISFYTLPEEIRNLTNVSVGTNTINLSWRPSNGTMVSYLVNIQPGNSYTTCASENCCITNLQPGQKYFFTVSAMVNGTIFGEPSSIDACTKPSKVINLTSSNNNSHIIYAEWDSPDNNSWQYTYYITLDCGNCANYTSTRSIELDNVTPGTNHTLTVSAMAPNCSEAGEAVSISAYTTPKEVSNLQLTSTHNNITATWDLPDGKFAWFNVTIFSPMSDNSSFSSTTTMLKYTFTPLKTAALYTVIVTTYVKEDLSPSQPTNKSIYTKPNPPGNARVQTLNYTTVNLSWEIPKNSQGVAAINYSVKYFSDFWNLNGSLSLIGNNSVIIGGLKSGSKYIFNITVWAGELESLPSVTTGLTIPEIRTLTLMMMCSSSIQLYCMNDNVKQDVLTAMNNSIYGNLMDNVFWNLTVRT